MAEVVLSRRESMPISVLFPPESVPVVDIFRALGDFEDNYDIAALDALEERLARSIGGQSAKGIVSDALLLAFGLRRERRDPLSFGPLGSRRGTLDEYRLMALVSAAAQQDQQGTLAAAVSLGITRPQPLVTLAFDIAKRLKGAGVHLTSPDRRLLEGEHWAEGRMHIVVERPEEPRTGQKDA
jgi:hypothetical protein